MQVFRQNHDGIDQEGMILAGLSEGFAQRLDMLDQQIIALAFRQIHGEEVTGPVNTYTLVGSHFYRVAY